MRVIMKLFYFKPNKVKISQDVQGVNSLCIHCISLHLQCSCYTIALSNRLNCVSGAESENCKVLKAVTECLARVCIYQMSE